eukprot:scaffold23000_cov63-Phaeocystis_antarctica.AAC.1
MVGLHTSRGAPEPRVARRAAERLLEDRPGKQVGAARAAWTASTGGAAAAQLGHLATRARALACSPGPPWRCLPPVGLRFAGRARRSTGCCGTIERRQFISARSPAAIVIICAQRRSAGDI